MELQSLLLKIKNLTPLNQRKVSALIGATVADAATRPLHWIYDQKKLNQILKDTKEPEFWPRNESPFYDIPLGDVSGYNDTMLVALSSFCQTSGLVDLDNVCVSFKKHFGPGTEYADAFARRKVPYNPEKRSEFIGPVEGPWIQKAMISFLEKYEKLLHWEPNMGSSDVKEHDGLCAALPVISKLAADDKDAKDDASMWTQASKICKMLSTDAATLEMFHTEALIIQKFIIGSDDPVADVKNEIESLYPSVYEVIEEVEEAADLPYISTVAQLGKACYLPGSFQGALLAMYQTSSFVDAVRLNITAGGCNCCRANFIGACFGAKYGIDGIPMSWLSKVKNIESILEMATSLMTDFSQ